MVEELAEEREQRVERRRQTNISGHIGNEQRLVSRHATSRIACGRRVATRNDTRGAGLGAHREPRRGDSGRVGRGLIDNQVADHAWLRIDNDVARQLLLVRSRSKRPDRERRCDVLSIAEIRRRQPRERHIGSRELLTTSEQVVARPIHRAQPVARQPIRDLIDIRTHQRPTQIRRRRRSRVTLSNLDLLQNERQITSSHDKAITHPRRSRIGACDEAGGTQAEHRSRCADELDLTAQSPPGAATTEPLDLPGHRLPPCKTARRIQSFPKHVFPIPVRRSHTR